MPRVPAIAGRLYRHLLLLYPSEFRHEFGYEMACDFDEAVLEAWRVGGGSTVVALAIWITADLVRAVIAQWVRAGLPVVILISSTVALASVSAVVQGAVARTVLQPRIGRVVGSRPSMITLDVVSSATLVAALLMVAATIFTLWLAHSALRRRRL